MKAKTNISVRNNLGSKIISNMIIGESGEYTSGDILDANAVQEVVTNEITDLINFAPETLDTLGEIAETIGTVDDSISELQQTKADISALELYVTYDELHEILLSLDDNYYGITWTDANPTPTRIGNPTFHKSLPIQNMIHRCMVSDDGTVHGYINNADPTKYLDGTTADYTGAHGQCMVEIPEYHYDAYSYDSDNTKAHVLILYPYSVGGKLSKKFYAAAFEASSNDADSTASTKKLFSICTTNFTVTNNSVFADGLTYTADSAKYKGGNRSSSYGDDWLNSLLGRPITNLTRAGFRYRAAARGTGWSQQYWDAYMAIVRLYVVEYCNFNSLAAYNSSLTVEGYKQGGLGPGVSILESSAWDHWNAYNPFVPCGITKSLGSKTGVISYTIPAAAAHSYSTTTDTTVLVPSYRGIENPFGHIWNWTDGVNVYSDSTSGKTTVYTCNDITHFADNTTTNYVECAVFNTPSNGFIKTWNWDQNGDFIPTSTGGSEASYLYDYSYWSPDGWRVVRSGGCADYGARCGWFCFHAYDASSVALAGIGGRLYYTPTE